MGKKRLVKSVAGYMKAISAIEDERPNSTLAFRGVKDKTWLLESSAEFRLKKSRSIQGRVSDWLFLRYNEDLIKKCTLKNYNQRERGQLYDLELLADLQHHGAATCLIDFTRNALVALWFACQESGAAGKVFVVNTDQRAFREITPDDIKDKSISNILEFKTQKTDKESGISVAPLKFWHWRPAHLNERIPAQHSLFLFGLPSSGEMSSEEIIIGKASKEQIRKELNARYDICAESLFPDFVGFATHIQHAHAPYALSAEEYFHRGVTAQQRGQYSVAIQYFTEAIKLKSDYVEAYYARGLVYDRNGEYDQAIQDFTEAIKLKSDYAEAHYDRGGAYYSKGEYDQAIQDFTEAIKLKSDYVEAYAFRGLAYSSKYERDRDDIQDLTRAIEDLTKAIELKSDYAEAYLIRGGAYYRNGEYDQAIQDLTKAIELKSDYVEAYAFRGLVYRSKYERDRDDIQDLTKAIEDLTKAIELKENDAEAYYARAFTWLHLEKWQEAKSDLTAAKKVGIDIVAWFRSHNQSITDFEQKTGITLPGDIAAMLTDDKG